MAQPLWEPKPGAFEEEFARATGVKDLAARLGISLTTLYRYCARQEPPIDLGPVKNIAAGSGGKYVTGSLAEQHERDLEMQRLKDENTDLRRKYAADCKTENLYADLLKMAEGAMAKCGPVKPTPPHLGKGKTREDAILGWADWHAGEVVDYDVMQGYNAYDPAIMCRRAQYTVDDTLDTLFGVHTGTTFGRLWVFDLGDGITGDLLDEAKATNALPVYEAMLLVVRLRERALRELASHIPVTYVAVPGNHPRRSPKMQWKRPTDNGDWYMAEQIADRCRDEKRIQFVVPKAWTAVVNVRGWNHSLNHGYSAAKGGYGGIPWYSYQRTDGKLTALESAHGQRVNYRWYGHVHQKSELPMMDGEGDQFIIGSLMGGNEYAKEGLSAYADPVQKLVGCHDKYGVSWRQPLNVKHADDKPSRYEELIV